MDDAAIVILAGGRATRFPGKLEYPIGGVPMLVQVYRNVRATGLPVYIAGNQRFTPAVEAALDCPMLADEHPGSGPLTALLSACQTVESSRIFAVAGDAPMIDASVLQRVADAWESGDEASVARHDERIEPLTALYERSALMREGSTLVREGKTSMHALVERLQTRFVELPNEYFLNVNTRMDLPT